LQRIDDLGADEHGIDPEVRTGGVSADSFYIDRERIRSSHYRARTNAECADWHAWIVVHAVNFVDAEPIHESVIDHHFAAAAALFRRLENDDSGPRKISRLREVARGAEQHRGMAIVPARMHFPRDGRFIR